MSSKLIDSKGFPKDSMTLTNKTIKKTQTFNQKQTEANELLIQSIKSTMTDKRRLCEKIRYNNSLTNSPQSRHALTCRSAFSPNPIISHNLTYGNTDENSDCWNHHDYSLYKDIKLEFIENDKKDKKPKYEFDIDPLLMCLICKGLMINPCKCYKCSTLYCKNCIEKAIIKTSKCPKCFNLVSNNNLIPVDMSSIYASTVIKCLFPGCKDHFNLLDIKAHLLVCAFKEAKEIQRVNVNKILPDAINDSYIKLHLMNFVQKINKTEIDFAQSLVLTEEEQKIRNEDDSIQKDIKTLKSNIDNFNINIEKTVMDMSNATKKTNENIKNLLKKVPTKYNEIK